MIALDRHSWIWIALFAAGCASQPRSAAPSSDVEVVRPEASSEPDREPAPQASTGAGATAIIEHDGVADVRLGKPIPARHLDERGAIARYDIRWIADAQPFEAWRVDELRVIALFRGPFTRWAESNVGELEPGRFLDAALRELRDGAHVQAILIESKGPRTARGIGVGSTWRELVDAYPEAKIVKDPELFEPRPTCVVHAPDQPGATFHLASCDGDPGDVVRVFIYRP